MVTNPSIILADEPTGALDSESTSDMLDLFDVLHDEGRTIIVITHEHDVAERAARVIRLRDGTPYARDQRPVLRRQLAAAAAVVSVFPVRPEIEFFLFAGPVRQGPPEPLDEGSYFDLTPLDVGSDFRRQTIEYLEQMGIPVKASHHEVGASQHEMDLKHNDALSTAEHADALKMALDTRAMHSTPGNMKVVRSTPSVDPDDSDSSPEPRMNRNSSGWIIQLRIIFGSSMNRRRSRHQMARTARASDRHERSGTRTAATSAIAALIGRPCPSRRPSSAGRRTAHRTRRPGSSSPCGGRTRRRGSAGTAPPW